MVVVVEEIVSDPASVWWDFLFLVKISCKWKKKSEASPVESDSRQKRKKKKQVKSKGKTKKKHLAGKRLDSHSTGHAVDFCFHVPKVASIKKKQTKTTVPVCWCVCVCACVCVAWWRRYKAARSLNREVTKGTRQPKRNTADWFAQREEEGEPEVRMDQLLEPSLAALPEREGSTSTSVNHRRQSRRQKKKKIKKNPTRRQKTRPTILPSWLRRHQHVLTFSRGGTPGWEPRNDMLIGPTWRHPTRSTNRHSSNHADSWVCLQNENRPRSGRNSDRLTTCSLVQNDVILPDRPMITRATIPTAGCASTEKPREENGRSRSQPTETSTVLQSTKNKQTNKQTCQQEKETTNNYEEH